MKHILLIAFTSFMTTSYCQDFKNKKAIKGNIIISFDSHKDEFFPTSGTVSTNTNNNFNISFFPTFGKFTSRNIYFSYGPAVRYNSQKNIASNGNMQKSNSWGLGATLSLQKFKNVKDRVYFSPYVNLIATYGKSKVTDDFFPNLINRSKSIVGTFSFVPISFSYQLNDKVIINTSFGNFQLDYLHAKSKQDNQTAYGIVNNITARINTNSLFGASCIFLL